MAQFIVLVILGIAVYQTERKIFTLQMEPNTPEEVLGEEGEWRDRTQKHRYVMVFDKSLDLLWTDESIVISNRLIYY